MAVKKIAAKKKGAANKAVVKKTVTTRQNKKLTKTDSAANRNYGLTLFIQGVSQKDIADRCDVSEQTITEWKKKYDWDTKKAARSISLEELANKCIKKASDMLDEPQFNSDSFAKAIAQLKTLLPKNTADTDIMTFLSFQDFLLEIRHDEGLDEEFLKRISKYQDRFIKRKLGFDE